MGLLSGVRLIVGVLLRVLALGGGGAMVAPLDRGGEVSGLGGGGSRSGRSSSSLRSMTSGRRLVIGLGVAVELRGVLLGLAVGVSWAFLGQGVWGAMSLILPALGGFTC